MTAPSPTPAPVADLDTPVHGVLSGFRIGVTAEPLVRMVDLIADRELDAITFTSPRRSRR